MINKTQSYMQEIMSYPLLSQTVEYKLFKQYHHCKESITRHIECSEEYSFFMEEARKIKEKIIYSNLRLVIAIAKKFYSNTLDFMDLIQEGNLGLIKAIDQFDYKKGFRFSTYATYWIEQHIYRAIQKTSSLIHIPFNLQDKIQFIKKSIKYNSNCSDSFIEHAINCGYDKDQSILMNEINSMTFTSLNQEVNIHHKRKQLIELIADKNIMYPDVNHNYEEFEYEILKHVELLNPREKAILFFHYGLKDIKTHNYIEIGKKLKLSPVRIRQIEIIAIKKLKEILKKKGVI